jgi:hypothetical protein
MGILGFVVGTIAGQLCGASAYRRIASRSATESHRVLKAAVGAGLTTATCASLVYILLGVHNWAGGAGSSWSLSVFLGLCMGLCQAVLFRDRPRMPVRGTRT